MWGPWEAPIWGAWWIFPLFGLLFMIVMMMFCARMRGMIGGGGMCGHGGRHVGGTDDLRREVHDLREEIQRLRAGS
jgi:hypothetical protein